ncbi:exo-beta-N-acetylmuramidase NamZ domain-containing protein [Pontibacter locisalis]|uniref:Exo-beta-N-acetylmuramidase NamZ domain-containing protein n=1 Tax=Pontibacter locisalis TaxID=1719035 RepID=A0ABW5IIE5_9BACT
MNFDLFLNMMTQPLVILYTSLLLAFNGCTPKQATTTQPAASETEVSPEPVATAKPLRVGAERMDQYLSKLKGKRVGVVVNQTSIVGETHLVDTLLSRGVEIKTIFAPEHGFRGEADAGAHIKDAKDTKTGLPIISLYGANKKPQPEQIKDLDVLVFDIQDVGTRFYTYISTMHYVMEAAAENNKEVLILDRPNPNGHYVDGPVLEKEQTSFVGMHPIPIVHGLTVGELAKMINGQKWLKDQKQANITVVPVANYTHETAYVLPVKPSPNLPNHQSIILYPSLCLFEGTNVSVGRGTPTPFQVIGSPYYTGRGFSFTPVSTPGATNPPYKGQTCYGMDLTQPSDAQPFTLSYLLEMYQNSTEKDKFFNNFFEKLAGTSKLREQVKSGKTEAEIRASWEPELSKYKTMRKQYLLYPDFK